MARVVAELIKRRTKVGDAWFVGHVALADGGWTRLAMFFDETRLNADGEVVEVWQLRAEEVLSRPSRYEVAPPPSRRIGAVRGARPGTAARPEGHPADRA